MRSAEVKQRVESTKGPGIFSRIPWKALVVLSTCVGAIVVSGFAWGTSAKPAADLTTELSHILEDQTACWNQGDIDGFMNAYWKSEKLTFASGGEVERGWDATLARYKRRYPDAKAMGKVIFSKLEVQPLGDEAALMLGRWKLEREMPIDGNFTLVWQKIDGQWKIVHDHTSKTP